MSQTVEFRRCKDGSLDYGHYRRVAQRLRYQAMRVYVRGLVRAAGFGRSPTAETAMPQSAAACLK
jgi:hypothetical protein